MSRDVSLRKGESPVKTCSVDDGASEPSDIGVDLDGEAAEVAGPRNLAGKMVVFMSGRLLRGRRSR